MESDHSARPDLPPPAEAGESPRHGFQGNRAPAPPPSGVPAGLTVAISRETGARGGTIGRRVGRKLGWQVVDQDLLEFLTQDDQAFAELPPAAREWADHRLDQLLRARVLTNDASVIGLARVVLLLGAQGEVVLVGRGAGYLLPPATTLHVRIVAPEADRIAYMAQWQRLTTEEAADEVRKRDNRRGEFLATHLGCTPNDPYPYDLIVNSSRLGEEPTAELIAQAARGKLLGLEPDQDSSPAGAQG